MKISQKTLKGSLKLLDTTKQVSFKADIKDVEGLIGGTFTLDINRHDYGLSWQKPNSGLLKKVAGKSISDKVDIRVNVLAKKVKNKETKNKKQKQGGFHMKLKKGLPIALMATGVFAGSTVFAVKEAQASKSSYYKCKGVATKWAGDCGANDHACAGKNPDDFDANEWVKVSSKSDCTAIQTALKNPAIKKYVLDMQADTVSATKQGKFGK